MTEPILPPALAADMQQVDAIVAERVRSRAAVISVAGAEVGGAGRPRLHAALVLLGAAVGAYRTARVLHAAAAVELILAATRAHDALVDEAGRRRGQPPVGEWSHGVALMVGDYLFALAAGEMALSPEPRVISYFSQAVMRISEAALTPTTLLPPAQAEAQHLERLRGAHGALYAAACQAGAACGGLPDAQSAALGQYGERLGLALALAAELRDLESAAPLPASLRRGSVSLPLIAAAAAGDAERLAAAINGGDPAELAWAAAAARQHGVARTRAIAASLAAEAQAALGALPPGEARDALNRVAARAVSPDSR